MNKYKKRALERPGFWVHKYNLELFSIINKYMIENNMNQTELAELLGVSRSRISQLLNDGEANFTMEKISDILIKLGYFPNLNFIKKEDYFVEKQEETDGEYLNKSVRNR